ncbi:MAG: leucine--tRNA ligase [Flavobacteriales bacterium]|jgi:leucyl-tRNA synthetase|uniref:leucine--tRNA ligase n=1 Tax=Blattabacterium sp. (Mastotermes darwiniensis) TaxID=39768 RepID=UPI000231DED7|nr:leucine--tRNA ligase [Blattabacterium sp. (Mastotermes darwiniensis)]AER40779.1 leucyl-tRNA synthetase [Blattabacterium sp. (Mastotermes darwiniensis) str. MADAR]MDR1804624.1 leucine--tRNA ligase [Flavobacteriales bacterium]
MEYNFRKIEKRWQIYWKKNEIFHTKENDFYTKKYYILNMFPYPSGTGLHIGHCLGYIASDVYARYKRAKGYNVLNPIGFDSFGLPAEQYAIQTGQHPYETTRKNIQRYQKQLNKIGLSFDWKRQLCTSNPDYYRWTQWMFIQIFNSWYDKNSDKAQPIELLIDEFKKNGNLSVNASNSFNYKFDSKEWKEFSSLKKETILLDYRLAFLCKNTVNWCPELGTVLANDEIKNGKSQRGGYSIYKRKMLQWHIRITAYAERLLKGLEFIDCSKSLKKLQYNWIGKKKVVSIFLKLLFSNVEKIEFFIHRPEIIFGMTFIVLSTDHPLVEEITISSNKKKLIAYKREINSIEKQLEKRKSISGFFTGNYVLHPFIKRKKIPIYVSNYFSVDTQTKSTIGIPSHEKCSQKFAEYFGLEILPVFIPENNTDPNKKNEPYEGENGICINSDFLNGLKAKEAREKIIKILEKKNIGVKKNSYRLRDAVFSRQRYWGEPIPIYFKGKIPKTIPIEKLPLILPKIENYHPKNGKSPLMRVKNWAWDEKNMKIVSNTLIDNKYVFPIETNTMPCWAGSSWYFLRYMDVHNNNFFLDHKKENYWKNIDLYIGGSEHSTGHLIYARFWHKFLKDRGWIRTEEPFNKILNQGMILSHSAIILKIIGKNTFISYGLRKKYGFPLQEIYVDISLINQNNELNIKKFKQWRPEFYNYKFISEKEIFFCKRKLEKMSKSKYNVINPDHIYDRYGSDIFRIYEMFLGPITQSKPWDDQKINGIKNFVNKFWRLFHNKNGIFQVSNLDPTFQELKILHSTIKKLQEKIESFSFNTSISYLMIIVNKLTNLECNKRKILEPLVKLMAPFSPHIAEEIWRKLGSKKSILFSSIPIFDPKYLVEKKITYPIMFNGKLKFKEIFDSSLTIEKIKYKILNHPKTKFVLKNKVLQRVIIIKNKIINILIT